jgi:hypothetical protein
MFMRTFSFLSAGLLLGGALTHGAELLRYNFGLIGQETTVETSPAYGPTISAANLTASPVRDVAGNVAIEISSAATTPVGAPFLRVDPQGNSTTAVAAVAANKYFEFTVTPDSGFALNLDSLAFDVTRGGGSTPRGYSLFSSANNFTTSLAGGDLATARPTYTPVTAALGGTHTGLTAPTTFRFYVYAPAAGNSIDFDNFVLNGSVTVVPEPGTISLMALGTLGLIGLVRRQRR